MENPRLLDLHILRALQYRSGDVSYIKNALSQADISLGKDLPCFHWKDMSRKEVWNCTNALVKKGYISRRDIKCEATTKDKAIYDITEQGKQYLFICDYSYNSILKYA